MLTRGWLQRAAAIIALIPTRAQGVLAIHWVDTWTAMPQLTEPANLPPPPFVRKSPSYTPTYA